MYRGEATQVVILSEIRAAGAVEEPALSEAKGPLSLRAGKRSLRFAQGRLFDYAALQAAPLRMTSSWQPPRPAPRATAA